MAAEHLQGQDVQLTIKKDGKVLTTLSAIQSFEISVAVAAQELAFLGERGPRIDMTYGGVSFSFELRHRDSGFHTFVDAVKSTAQHRTPGVRFSIQGSIAYPNGEMAKFLIQDVGFDGLPFSVGGQAEFVTSRISGKAQDMKVFGAAAI